MTCSFSLTFNNADAAGVSQTSLTHRARIGQSFVVVHEVRDLSMDVDYSGTEGLVGFKAFHFKDILDPCTNEIVKLEGSEVLPANSLVPIIGEYSTNVLTSASFLLGQTVSDQFDATRLIDFTNGNFSPCGDMTFDYVDVRSTIDTELTISNDGSIYFSSD